MGGQATEPVIPVIPLESDQDSLVTLSLSLSLISFLYFFIVL